MSVRLISLVILMLLPVSWWGAVAVSAASVLAGTATVIDGDTLEIHGQRIRLHAIDAPESRQHCWTSSKESYPCGRRSALALADKIGRSPVTCSATGRDRYRRIVAVCFLAGTNLNEWMVDQGWAVAFRRYGNDFTPEEDNARRMKRGLWAGNFEMPWDWRAANR